MLKYDSFVLTTFAGNETANFCNRCRCCVNNTSSNVVLIELITAIAWLVVRFALLLIKDVVIVSCCYNWWASWSVWPDDGVKSCPIFPKIAQKVTKSFYTKVVEFRIAQKITRIFGLLLEENFFTRSSKNNPIWSHWSWWSFLYLSMFRLIHFLTTSWRLRRRVTSRQRKQVFDVFWRSFASVVSNVNLMFDPWLVVADFNFVICISTLSFVVLVVNFLNTLTYR